MFLVEMDISLGCQQFHHHQNHKYVCNLQSSQDNRLCLGICCKFQGCKDMNRLDLQFRHHQYHELLGDQYYLDSRLRLGIYYNSHVLVDMYP